MNHPESVLTGHHVIRLHGMSAGSQVAFSRNGAQYYHSIRKDPGCKVKVFPPRNKGSSWTVSFPGDPRRFTVRYGGEFAVERALNLAATRVLAL